MVCWNNGFLDGRKLVQKSKLQSEKTRVGFGRTELSFGAIGKSVCVLSHGHGFKGPCFQGVHKSSDSHIWLDRALKVFMKMLDGRDRILVSGAENDTK